VSDVDPAELPPQRVASESFEEDTVDVPPASTSKKPEREGLPPGYKMRADPHYVDLITSRRSERAASDLPRGSRKSERQAEPQFESAERADARLRGDRILGELAEDLATIDAAAGLLSGDASRMARRANIDIIRAEIWRASWLLRAHAIVDGTMRAAFRPKPLAAVLGQIRSGFAPECRLCSINLKVLANDWNAVVPMEESSVVAAVTGAIIATLGVLGQADDSQLVVHATTGAHELKSIEVMQDELAISPDVGARFFDASWAERPGGWVGGLGAAVAKQVAQQHGGEAVFLVGDRLGSTLRLNFSRG
jgi:hypothetical protein